MVIKKSIAKMVLFTFILAFSAKAVDAKLLPRFKGVTKKSSGVSSGVLIIPRLRSDKKALSVNFANLNKVKNVTYTLVYQTSGKDEGVSGSLDFNAGNSTTRELLFGTCSAGVCRYHAAITNMRLEVMIENLAGKKFLRKFRIRI